MNAITTALKIIKARIPLEILNIGFMTPISLIPGKQTTLDDQITNLVIKDIVATELNLVKGITFTIQVDKCNQYHIAYNPTANLLVIDVPYELTNYRDIINVLSLTYYPLEHPMSGFTDSPAYTYAEKAVDAMSTMVGGITTSNLELIGPNTVLVHDNLLMGVGGHLRVEIENDNEFRNIKPQAMKLFSELCLYATQGWLYNKLVIEIDKGYIYGGHELSKFADILDSYSDAWEKFDEKLKEEWYKVSFMNDNVEYSRYINSLINPVL